MRDPLWWSFPLCHVFGITVRIHIVLPLVMLAVVGRMAYDDNAMPGTWKDAAWLMGLLFVAVLLHEFGHCYAARRMDGEASEVLLWPLGGLARVEVPHTARANFITAAGGPMVNLLLCVAAALAMAFLLDHPYRPSWNPLSWLRADAATGFPYRFNTDGLVKLQVWGHADTVTTDNVAAITLARFFLVNWVLLLLNVILVGFPLDGGRMLQCALWPSLGYRQATAYAIYAGFFCMFVVLFASFVIMDPLPMLLAAYIYVSCKQEWIVLETGGEESVFGYDFSQGYTSLERDEPAPVKPRQPNFIQRWLRRRADRKRQQEQEQQIAEERRMDELLEKIQRHGKESLTDEEQRFLKRVANRYRKKSP
jgi:stage IV sporulation protein FB